MCQLVLTTDDPIRSLGLVSERKRATGMWAREKAKLAEKQAADAAALAAKKERAQKIKNETRPEVASAAKYFFYSRRKMVAAGGRMGQASPWLGRGGVDFLLVIRADRELQVRAVADSNPPLTEV